MRLSFRLNKRVTSITLRTNIIALWASINQEDQKKDPKDPKDSINIQALVQNFVDKCIDEWKSDSAKGLSDFVMEMMIKDILEEKDFKSYKKYQKVLEEL